MDVHNIEPLGKRQRITDELVNAYGGEDAVRKMLKLALDQFSRTILDWDLPYTQVNELRIVPGFNTATKPIHVDGPAIPLDVYCATGTANRWVLEERHMELRKKGVMAGPRLAQFNSSVRPDFATNTAKTMGEFYQRKSTEGTTADFKQHGRPDVYWLRFRIGTMHDGNPRPYDVSVAQEGNPWDELHSDIPPQFVIFHVHVEPHDSERAHLRGYFRLKLSLPPANHAQRSLVKVLSRRRFQVSSRGRDETSPSVFS